MAVKIELDAWVVDKLKEALGKAEPVEEKTVRGEAGRIVALKEERGGWTKFWR